MSFGEHALNNGKTYERSSLIKLSSAVNLAVLRTEPLLPVPTQERDNPFAAGITNKMQAIKDKRVTQA